MLVWPSEPLSELIPGKVGLDPNRVDGLLAHLPSGRFPANAAEVICAAMTHDLQ